MEKHNFQDNEEKYAFEDNDKNQLQKISFNKKMFFIGISVVILIVIVSGLVYGKIVFPARRDNLEFKGTSLYILMFSGIIWMYHFIVQILGSETNDDKKNNQYFKHAYNSRIFGTVILILAYVMSFFKEVLHLLSQ